MWTRSCFCESGQCLEVNAISTGVLVRNSSNPDVPPIFFTFDQWPHFLENVKSERPSWWWFREQDDIVFSHEEASAFKAGVLAGEFDLENIRGSTDVDSPPRPGVD